MSKKTDSTNMRASEHNGVRKNCAILGNFLIKGIEKGKQENVLMSWIRETDEKGSFIRWRTAAAAC